MLNNRRETDAVLRRIAVAGSQKWFYLKRKNTNKIHADEM